MDAPSSRLCQPYHCRSVAEFMFVKVYRYFKPPFPRSARAAGSREAVNRAVFGDNPPLSMTIHPLNRPESPRFDAI